MEAFEWTWVWIIGGATVIIGFGSTVVYYFARYYFKTKDDDHEVVSSLKESPVEATSELASPPLLKTAPLEEREEGPRAEPPIKVVPQKVEKPKELREALFNTKQGLWGRIKGVFGDESNFEDDDFENLEEILYTSDLGPQTVQRLVEAISRDLNGSEKKNAERVRSALKNEMMSIFSSLESGEQKILQRVNQFSKPTVIMIVGVNGAGKTTTIGKLANLFAENHLKTMVVAGDTFRAAAKEQLQVWSQRAEVEIFNPENVQDPSAVAFDGCTSAKAKGSDVVIVDTAGRLHTQSNLMDELKKMKRVIQKVLPEAPHEVLIVLDANSGQNALVQAKMFHEALELSGVVLTKLDGTAKGGVAVGLACELNLPIRLIGVGEGLKDLRDFEPQEFVDSII